MEAEIHGRPSFAHVRVQLGAGDRIVAESDAMASMSSTIEMSTRFNGGLMGGLLKRFLGQESLFVNEFSTATKGELVLTQPCPGDIVSVDLAGTSVFLQPGAFVAAEPGLSLGVGWAGLGSLIAREGLFRLKVSGTGRLWFGAYGGVFAEDVKDEIVVDSGHLVAYEPSVSLRLGLAGGIFSSFFGGEGLVARMRGPGRIWLQSRSMDSLAGWTNAYL